MSSYLRIIMAKSLGKSENQPFPELGVLYDYDFGREQIEEDVWDDSFANADRSRGNFFVFGEAESDLEKEIDERRWNIKYLFLEPDQKDAVKSDPYVASLRKRRDDLWASRPENWITETG
jgi:hypothetical protein